MKLIRTCPLLFLTAVVSIILSGVTFALRNDVYSTYAEGFDSAKLPLFSVMMRGISDGVYPWEEIYEMATTGNVDRSVAAPDEGGAVDEEVTAPTPENTVSGNDISGNSDVSGNDVSGNSGEEIYEFREVDDDYFNDALFIGDSRTVGLSEYVEALDTRATFYAKVSLTIYSVMDKPFLKTEDGKKTVEEALSENEFKKIYIMLGLNEMGTGNVNTFTQAYADVICRIRELQPDAIIYIQGIMHVTADKSDVDKHFNNPNINERNEAISQLADNKTIFYIDMNESVDDEEGNLLKELSFDDVHLKASAYERWHQYLLQHAIVKE